MTLIFIKGNGMYGMYFQDLKKKELIDLHPSVLCGTSLDKFLMPSLPWIPALICKFCGDFR